MCLRLLAFWIELFSWGEKRAVQQLSVYSDQEEKILRAGLTSQRGLEGC